MLVNWPKSFVSIKPIESYSWSDCAYTVAEMLYTTWTVIKDIWMKTLAIQLQFWAISHLDSVNPEDHLWGDLEPNIIS